MKRSCEKEQANYGLKEKRSSHSNEHYQLIGHIIYIQVEARKLTKPSFTAEEHNLSTRDHKMVRDTHQSDWSDVKQQGKTQMFH